MILRSSLGLVLMLVRHVLLMRKTLKRFLCSFWKKSLSYLCILLRTITWSSIFLLNLPAGKSKQLIKVTTCSESGRLLSLWLTHSTGHLNPGGWGGRAFETLNTKHFKNDCKPLKALVNTFKTLFVLLSKKTLIYSISEAGRLQCCKNFFF